MSTIYRAGGGGKGRSGGDVKAAAAANRASKGSVQQRGSMLASRIKAAQATVSDKITANTYRPNAYVKAGLARREATLNSRADRVRSIMYR